MQMTAPTPQTTERLSAVNSDMADLLAVVTLCKANLSFVLLYPDEMW
jgi:hypothetical protein